MFSTKYITEWSTAKCLVVSHMSLNSVISIPIELQKKSAKGSGMEVASHWGLLGSWLMNNDTVFSRSWSTSMADNPEKAGTQICTEVRLSREKTTPDNLEVSSHYILFLHTQENAFFLLGITEFMSFWPGIARSMCKCFLITTEVASWYRLI